MGFLKNLLTRQPIDPQTAYEWYAQASVTAAISFNGRMLYAGEKKRLEIPSDQSLTDDQISAFERSMVAEQLKIITDSPTLQKKAVAEYSEHLKHPTESISPGL